MPLDPSVVALVPGNLCRKFQLIPIDRRGDRLTVGILDPTDIVALDDVASVTDLFVEPVVVAQDALAQMFERFLRSDEELSELSSTIEEIGRVEPGVVHRDARGAGQRRARSSAS